MNHFNPVRPIAVAALLALSLLTGCGKNDPPNPTTPSASSGRVDTGAACADLLKTISSVTTEAAHGSANPALLGHAFSKAADSVRAAAKKSDDAELRQAGTQYA